MNLNQVLIEMRETRQQGRQLIEALHAAPAYDAINQAWVHQNNLDLFADMVTDPFYARIPEISPRDAFSELEEAQQKVIVLQTEAAWDEYEDFTINFFGDRA